jgi:hypothetical protein
VTKGTSRSIAIRLLALGVIFVVMLVDGWSQTVTSPTRTQCKQWDDAFLAVFHNALWIVPLLTILLGLGIGFVGRFCCWWATDPRLRILVATLFVLALSCGVAVGLWTLGPNHGWFGVDPGYLDCQTVRFDAEGLLGGVIGRGIPAIAQWQTIIILLLGVFVLGGLLALGINKALTRFFGMRSKIRGAVA